MRRSFLWVIIPLFVLACALEGALVAYHFTHLKPDTSALLRQGSEAIRSGNYDLAIHDYSEVLKTDPQSWAAFDGRGVAYAWKKDYDQAIADYDSALAIRSNDATTYYNLGLAYDGKRDEQTALRKYNMAILLRTNYPQAYVMRGHIYARMKDYDRALADFQQAEQDDPQMADAYYDAGYVHASKKEFQDAITEYGKAIDRYTLVDEHLPHAYLSRAAAYRHLGNYDAAMADCNKVMTFDGRNSGAYVQRGYIYLAQHDEEKADSDFQHAFGLETGDKQSGLYNNVAWTLSTSPDDSLRDGKLALTYAQKACELSSWQHPADIDTLAAACAETGDYANAVKWEQQYLATPNLTAKQIEDAKPRLGQYLAHQPFRDGPFVLPKVTPPPPVTAAPVTTPPSATQ
jgi:tetratricopeptide (TPR) repeat protein